MKMNIADNLIFVDGLTFFYRQGEGTDDTSAVEDVTLHIDKGMFLSIIGRNGSGKSTLAKSMNALVLPTIGNVVVDGFNTKDEASVWEIRQRVGMVFQNPDNQLVSAVVEDDVAFGPENMGVDPDDIRKRIRTSLDSVDMYEHRKMAPHLLSGGQKQRVAIAGILAMHPEIIIFDEPTAMLDPGGRTEVMEIMNALHKEGITIILITHFMEETVHSDKIVIMDNGMVVMRGTPVEIFSRSDEILDLGLKLPFAVEVAAGLRNAGVAVPDEILDAKGLAEYVIGIRNAGIHGN
jgi:energy-coupling factor transport system ATP-binding protein